MRKQLNTLKITQETWALELYVQNTTFFLLFGCFNLCTTLEARGRGGRRHFKKSFFFFFWSFWSFCLFRTTPAAYGGSQARGVIGAAAAGLHHSSQQLRILNPLSKARDQTHNLMVPSRICFCCATTGTAASTFLMLPVWERISDVVGDISESTEK